MSEQLDGDHRSEARGEVPSFSSYVELQGAMDDMAWLWKHRALTGVADIMRERRQQIESGKEPRYRESGFELTEDDVVMLKGELRRSGALAAFEISRLNRLVREENEKE